MHNVRQHFMQIKLRHLQNTFHTYNIPIQTGETTLNRRTAVRETGISRHHRDLETYVTYILKCIAIILRVLGYSGV